MDGREEWVPPTRLRILWESVEPFRAEEARWKAITDLSPPYWESVEFSAAEQDLRATRRPELFGWALGAGLRVVKPKTYMSTGGYRRPRGAWIPSVLA